MSSVENLSLVETNAGNNATNRRAVRAIVIGVEKRAPTVKQGEEAEPGRSKQLPEDPFMALAGAGRIIVPPFDLLTLAMLPEHNTELGPCVDAMEVNIEGFGHRFVPRFKEDAPDDVKKAALVEKVRLTNFFAYASMRDSFTAIRRQARKDLETTGNGYLEVIRDAAGGVQGLEHLPSYQTRLGRLEDEAFKVEIPILELQVDGSVEVARVPTWQRFRTFAQSRAIQRSNLTIVGDYKLRWFKEFGDPRVYDNETGEVVPDDKLAAMPDGRRANEVIHFKIYSPRSPYGLPRFVGQMLCIYGDRAAEEINYVTFKNNNIPSMMLLVSNGQLTQGTIDRISDFVESNIQGTDNYSKILIVEAEGDEEGEDSGQVKVDMKQLTEAQHKDALFQNYSKNNQEKIRRAFRLPPLFVGSTAEYSRAVAETSRRVADEQVFAPERDEVDAFINRRLFPEMAVVYHKFRSNTPNTTDNTELVKILAGAEKTGGMTPRIARLMLEDILGQELPDFPAEFVPKVDLPFSLLMAEAVKNKADPTEPGQQVTALKALEMIEKLTGGDLTEADEGALAEHAVRLNQVFERKWRAEVKGD